MKVRKKIFLVFIVILLFTLANLCYKPALKLFYPLKYEEMVYKASETYKVDKALIFAIIKCESGFDKNAHSHAGAHGLMQMTDETFNWLKSRYTHDENINESKLEDPKTSIFYGTLFLSILLEKYKNEETALSAYNAGISAVNRWLLDKKCSPNGYNLRNIPYKETRNYVKKVERTKNIYKQLYFE